MSNNKIICMVNVEDIKDHNGLWKRSWNKTENGVTTKFFTRAGVLWTALSNRTKGEDNADYIKSNYKVCLNKFEDYQNFVNWCHEQHGYLNRDSSGEYWHLDKDILVPNNNIYSRDTCVFCPPHINKALNLGKSRRGDYPVGVNYDKKHKKFMARHRPINGVTKYLGYFDDPNEAHKAWQKAKIETFEVLFSIPNLGNRLEAGLLRILNKLKFELENSLITTYY